jgi:hypothetical protein
VTGWLVPSAGQKTQYSMAGTFPLAENRFLQAGKLKIQRNLEPALGGYQVSSHISLHKCQKLKLKGNIPTQIPCLLRKNGESF